MFVFKELKRNCVVFGPNLFTFHRVDFFSQDDKIKSKQTTSFVQSSNVVQVYKVSQRESCVSVAGWN